ncbi:MAG: arsenate reductase (glutaredoxin) [Parvularculaceae bacterium]
MTVSIWHNPRCSKSRETLALLEERGRSPKIVHYLETPPTPAEIKAAAKLLGVPLREMTRKKENLYRELGLDDEALSDSALAKALSENPALIERPVVFSRGMARIGRPPEAILEIL